MKPIQWQIFFELVEAIVSLDGGFTWKDKRDVLLSKAEDCQSLNEWEELVEWFRQE